MRACECVRDSRPWGAHAGGSEAGARHCDINIPSLSAVNQRGNTSAHLRLRRADLRPGFRVIPRARG